MPSLAEASNPGPGVDADVDLAALRARLASLAPGRAVWRSLDDAAATPGFRRLLERQYPAVGDLASAPDRRDFLKLMAASLALSGLIGGKAAADESDQDGRDQEVPFVEQPEHANPGASLSFASVALIGGFANGILVTTRDGRPLKIEGNPQHPWSKGGTDIFAQASVLGLYDPQRSAAVRFRGRPSDWDAFRGATIGHMAAIRANQGEGLVLLTGPLTSPSLLSQIAALQSSMPRLRWHSQAGLDRSALDEASRRAFGQVVETRWRFERARVIVSLDGDFLDVGPQQVGAAHDWAQARRASIAAGGLLELHAAGSVPGLTSAKADYAAAVTPSELAGLAAGLMAAIGEAASDASSHPNFHGATPLAIWQARAAAALRGARGASLVVAGSHQPPEIHEAAHRINAALGNIGQTVFYTTPVIGQAGTMSELAEEIKAGSVKALVMLDTNPAYESPGELGFAGLLHKVALKIHAGLYEDETADRADWHLPLAHPLESWGDARSVDGTVGLLQPTISPLYGGRSAAEILSLLFDPVPKDGLALLRQHWQIGASETGDSETGASETGADETGAARWRQMLELGFIPESALEPHPVQLQPSLLQPEAAAAAPAAQSDLVVLIRPDPTILDGSFANNAWLQELPKPLTKLVWQNAISVSPRFAEHNFLAQGDRLTLTVEGRSIDGLVWILPGQCDNSVGITLGYGRRVPDMLFDGLGFDAYSLRAPDHPWRLTGASLHRRDGRGRLVTTQNHNTMEGHDFVRTQHPGAPSVGDPPGPTRPSLYGAKPNDGRAWGMVIDLDSCIGCNACVTACQSENNIAVVGPEQVAEGREMHWLRIDRYYEGGLDAPTTHFQPVPCMHCEDAPCEVGCPVEATLHDHEGLNLMVYNRCVGTRACSGYCPYKVRHFNYLDYSAGASPTLALQRNPEVTVRARGVMEKCTYCVQRIVAGRIDSDKTNTPIPDGSVQTACQGACPTRAISFGDLEDAGSAVTAARRDPRNYALLGELGVRPRTTYLAKMAPVPGAG